MLANPEEGASRLSTNKSTQATSLTIKNGDDKASKKAAIKECIKHALEETWEIEPEIIPH